MLARVSRTTVKDTAWALIGLGAPTALQLLYVIAAARGLGADQFGQLMLCVAVATVASFVAGVGGDGVALKAVARAHEAVAEYFGQALTLIVLTALPIAAGAVVLTLWLARVDMPLWLPVSIAVSEVLFGRVAMTCQKMFIAFSQQARAAVSGMFVPVARLVSALGVLLMTWQEPLGDIRHGLFRLDARRDDRLLCLHGAVTSAGRSSGLAAHVSAKASASHCPG